MSTTARGITPSEPNLTAAILEKVLVENDLEKLSPAQRLEYVTSLAQSLGLNPLTRPFQYIKLQGQLKLYATKDATDQLRRAYGVSIAITHREITADLYICGVKAMTADGRADESTGIVVFTPNMRPEDRANAIMKAETKAKRRVTLSICGLGILDESETDTIKNFEAFDETGTVKVVPQDTVVAARKWLTAIATQAEIEAFKAACKEDGLDFRSVISQAMDRAVTTYAELVAYAQQLADSTAVEMADEATQTASQVAGEMP